MSEAEVTREEAARDLADYEARGFGATYGSRLLRTVMALYDENERLQLLLGAKASEVEAIFLDEVTVRDSIIDRLLDGWMPAVACGDGPCWSKLGVHEPMTPEQQAVMSRE